MVYPWLVFSYFFFFFFFADYVTYSKLAQMCKNTAKNLIFKHVALADFEHLLSPFDFFLVVPLKFILNQQKNE